MVVIAFTAVGQCVAETRQDLDALKILNIRGEISQARRREDLHKEILT